MFSFEKMIAWQKAIEWVDEIFEVADHLPQKQQFSFGEQLRRACLSVPNNLAEGSGRRTPRGQRYFYDIAHGSTYEVVNILAILKRRGQVGPEEFTKFYKRGDELASIIYGLEEAAFEAEAKQSDSPRALRESRPEYGVVDEPEPPL
ncbi:MAG: ribosomal S23 superfamily protein [Anaerolineales bacterium]|nr:ribosomal S23 superfamily protein [Anaerolineales bacterium]